MKVMEFLGHYGLTANPFADEDAQTDPVFKDSCIETTRHPIWDKLYGNPSLPATSLAFGEKGSGKTALRLQMIRELKQYNSDHSTDRPFVIDYSDWNPWLDAFRNRQPRRRKPAKVLGRLQLQDHLDAVLALGVTQLVDRILGANDVTHPAAVDAKPLDVSALSPARKRDLLGLLIAYDHSRGEPTAQRFRQVARLLKYPDWKSQLMTWRELAVGVLGTVLFLVLFIKLGFLTWLWWFLALVAASWVWWLARCLIRFATAWSVARTIRTRTLSRSFLYSLLTTLPPSSMATLPVPRDGSGENRYDLLRRFLDLVESLGFNGALVLVDRVDEPYYINGSPELMKAAVWPLLDNKLLKQERIGFKLLLPEELGRFVEQETEEFQQRLRRDKQNYIPSLSWTGESLLELANARLAACSSGSPITMEDFFAPGVDRRRLVEVFASLRVPRRLFQFLYVLLVNHVTNLGPDADPWKITAVEFETQLARQR